MGTINYVGSLRYDMHGRKRKTNSLKKARSSRTVRTHGFHPCNVGSNPARATNQEVLEEYRQKFLVKSAPLKTDYDRAKEIQAAQDKQMRIEESKKFTVAPAYNKGAYQVIPRSDIKHIGK